MKLERELPATAAEWIAQVMEGELSHAQKSALAEWLRESPRHVREFVELTLLKDDLDAVTLAADQVDVWVQEARQSTAIPLSLSSPHPVSRATRGARSFGFTVAASVTLALVSIPAYQWWQDGRYTTGFGEQKILTLEDGSVVTLNTASALKVDFSTDKRALRLVKGEAFFRVAHDAARPFEVAAHQATVRALGTQFNVRMASRETVVSVLDGLVEVTEDANTTSVNAVQLKEGEEARIGRQVAARAENKPAVVRVERATASRAAAWTRGRVEFEAAPLAEVLAEFQRYREFSVDIAEPLRHLRLTGSFDAQDPESAFAYIDTLPGVKVDVSSTHTFVVRQR